MPAPLARSEAVRRRAPALEIGRRGVRMLRRLARAERGAAAVEFAVILPVLIAITFGIVQFGFAFSVYNTMLNASREAARAMAVEEFDAAQGEALANDYLNVYPSMSFTVAATEPDPADPSDRDVEVTITASLADAMVVDVLGIVGSQDLQTRTVMRRE